MKNLFLCCCVYVFSIASAAEPMFWENTCLNDTATTAFVSINVISGTDSWMCLHDKAIDCKTLAYVFDNVRTLNVACLKIMLKQAGTKHLLPSGLSLSGVSLYMAGEGGRAQITCSTNVETDNAPTSWSIQNAEVTTFKSLAFSNCSRRLEVVNTTNVYFHDVIFR